MNWKERLLLSYYSGLSIISYVRREQGVISVHKWIGLILIIIGTQVVAADGNEPKVVYVKESRSLWSVALSIKPTEVRMWQAVMALYERNPDAFYDNDVNKLKDNVALVVPSTEVMLSRTEAEALARFQLLGDQPQSDLDKVKLDTPSMSLVDLTSDTSLTAPIIPVIDNTKELTEDKAQSLTTLNQQDSTSVEMSCLSDVCSPNTTFLVEDRGVSDVGDFYVSFGVSKIKNYSLDYEPAWGDPTAWGSGTRTINYEFHGENGLEVNFGYLWRDGIVLELGYYRGNSELYSSKVHERYTLCECEYRNYGKNYALKGNRKTELVSPKVLFSNDIGNKMSIYTGFGVGLYKDTYRASDNVQNTTDSVTVYGGLYQIILGSKLHLTEGVFIDLRVQNKLYSPSTFSGTGVRAEGPSTMEGTFSIGMNL
jgi:FimV-like protein